ncbi:MAG: hypothetical protein LBQ62_10510 [Candidatus Accumulibacter sp.]|nr:hypothetical protein [Accumulibacter sp.]
MRKHIKREDGTPRAGKIIPLVITRTVEVPVSQAANDSRPGKLNYQAKTKKPGKPQLPARKIIERRTYANGKFFGDGEKLTAFVWLDEESAPDNLAAND